MPKIGQLRAISARDLIAVILSAAFVGGWASTKNVASEPLQPPDNLAFKSVLALKQKPTGIEPQLRGGMEATSLQWPASLYATYETPKGVRTCTASLLSSTVAITAAHCVPKNRAIRFTFNDRPYEAQCDPHPQYAQDKSADYGLCLLKPELAAPAGLLYERLLVAPLPKPVGVGVLLTGFGCTSDLVKNKGEVDGKYRIGLNVIAETSRSAQQTFDAQHYAPLERYNLFTERSGANVCPGDSGGPAFALTDGSRTGEFPNRAIIGINSRVFYEDDEQTRYGSSLISATGTDAFAKWAKQWAQALAKDRKVEICGLFGSPSECR